MRRREFISGFGTVIACAQAAAIDQVGAAEIREGRFRIGLLVSGGPTGKAFMYSWHDAFADELRKYGYVEGANTTFEDRGADGRFERLPALAAELVALKPDVIVTGSTPAVLALKQTGSSVPVVFAGLADPVGSGVVESLSRPGGNITGIAQNTVETAAKQLQLLKDLLPNITRIAVLENMLNPGAVRVVTETKQTAAVLDIVVTPIGYQHPEDLPAAFDRATQIGAEAIVVPSDPVALSNRKAIAAAAREKKLPTMHGFPIEAIDGGLISYGADLDAQYRRAAIIVDKILRGAKPADLPVELPTVYRCVVNLKTARALGLTIPPSLLVRADEVIE